MPLWRESTVVSGFPLKRANSTERWTMSGHHHSQRQNSISRDLLQLNVLPTNIQQHRMNTIEEMLDIVNSMSSGKKQTMQPVLEIANKLYTDAATKASSILILTRYHRFVLVIVSDFQWKGVPCPQIIQCSCFVKWSGLTQWCKPKQ